VESAVEFYNDEQVRESRNAYRLKYCQLYYCIGSNPSKLDFAFSLARWAKCIGTSSSTKPSKIR
jgi:hypothetical protein